MLRILFPFALLLSACVASAPDAYRYTPCQLGEPSPEPAVAKYFKPGAWNQMTVSAHGRRIVVHVNGRKTAELPSDESRLSGKIALQMHGSQDVEVHFKDIETLVAAAADEEPGR